MNGSVAASTSMLVHAALPRWREAGLGEARAAALTAVTSTLGVIVPPSLVLLLLGDAMLRAHTEALTLAGTHAVRVINTQDLVQACAPVALLLMLAWAATAWWQARGSAVEGTTHRNAPRLAGAIAALAVAALLTAVALGWVRAVEAAATAALGAFCHAALSGRLARGGLARVLDHAMSLTGALFALLLAATTLSLVLRAAGCDLLVSRALVLLQGHPMAATLLVLAVLLALAFVLDAIELVFLVVPLVMPPLLVQVPDAAWVGCLTLLALQAGFLLPPWGYAVVLTRSMARGPAVPQRALARALLPYLGALSLVAAVVLAFPPITHWLRSAPMTLDATEPAGDVEELLRRMSPPPADDAAP
jgi:TRAP-type mannitol/chloroaromatic compound transport system permease large subunit